MEANGYGVRGDELSQANLAVAIKEDPMHKYISSAQKRNKMNVKNLKGVSWRKNVLDNIKLCKEAGIPRYAILKHAIETRKFAIREGF